MISAGWYGNDSKVFYDLLANNGVNITLFGDFGNESRIKSISKRINEENVSDVLATNEFSHIRYNCSYETLYPVIFCTLNKANAEKILVIWEENDKVRSSNFMSQMTKYYMDKVQTSPLGKSAIRFAR